MSNDDLKGLEPKANKTNYVGSDSEEGMSTMTGQLFMRVLLTPQAVFMSPLKISARSVF